MPAFPTGTVTFLFTDIEGSTRISQQIPETWETLRLRHNAILKAAVETCHGYTFQIIGDAFCCAFSSVSDALQAACKMQLNLSTEDLGPTPIRVRIGIHTGKADVYEDGQYSGYAVLSRVQRLMSAGHGGQTLISLTAKNLLGDDLPPQTSLYDIGERRLKDMAHPEHIFQVNIVGLPVDFPPLKTLDTRLNNLPVEVTPFIGREREIAAVLNLLRNPSIRLVTLTGAGGTGKTRLSQQVAAELLDDFEQGVWFVELDTITDPELVLPAIASVLKVKESAGASLEKSLSDFLSSRSLLLVLDNFEQVISAASLLGRLLASASRLKILVSSREVLHLRSEHDYPVPPLGIPVGQRKQTAAVIAQYESVALFLQHARAANPSFEINDENASSIAEICVKLDGLPLAIELAAARSRMFKPSAMLEKLKSSLNLLTGGSRDLPQRQQTIRGAIDWSFDLLESDEKRLFARLGIFRGGWTVESAEAVCGDELPFDVLTGLESLLDKSLIRQVEGRNSETRFTMLETIQEYAAEKLVQYNELPLLQHLHAGFIENLLKEIIGKLSGPEESAGFARLDDEIDNLRSAVAWSLNQKQPATIILVARLFSYWDQRARFAEPLGWLERSLRDDTYAASVEKAQVMNGAGNLLISLSRHKDAQGYYESAIQIFRENGDQKGIRACLNNLGNIAMQARDYESANQLYQQSLQINDGSNLWTNSMVLNNLGTVARIQGEWQAAKDYYLLSRKNCETLGTEVGISYTEFFMGQLALAQHHLEDARKHFLGLINAPWMKANPHLIKVYGGYIGYIDLLQGNSDSARQKIHDAFLGAAEFLGEVPNSNDLWFVLEGKARLELADRHYENAALFFGAAQKQRERGDYLITEFERAGYEDCQEQVRSNFGESLYSSLFSQGYEMNIIDAIQAGLQE